MIVIFKRILRIPGSFVSGLNSGQPLNFVERLF